MLNIWLMRIDDFDREDGRTGNRVKVMIALDRDSAIGTAIDHLASAPVGSIAYVFSMSFPDARSPEEAAALLIGYCVRETRIDQWHELDDPGCGLAGIDRLDSGNFDRFEFSPFSQLFEKTNRGVTTRMAEAVPKKPHVRAQGQTPGAILKLVGGAA